MGFVDVIILFLFVGFIMFIVSGYHKNKYIQRKQDSSEKDID